MSSKADVMEEYDDDVQESGLTEAKGRPTPGRRQKNKNKTEVTTQRGNMITRPIYGFLEYLGDVRSEIDKVTWPSREDVIRLTRIVILVTIVSAIALGFISVVLTRIFTIGLTNPVVFMVLIVVMIVIGLLLTRGGRSSSKY